MSALEKKTNGAARAAPVAQSADVARLAEQAIEGATAFRTGHVLERGSPILLLQFASVVADGVGDRWIAEGDSSMNAPGSTSAPMIEPDDLVEGHGPPPLPTPSSSGTMVKDALPVLEILREGSEPPRPRVQRESGGGRAIAKVIAVVAAFAVVGVGAGFGLRAIAGQDLARVQVAEAKTPSTDLAAQAALGAKTPPPATAKPAAPNAQPARASLPPPPPAPPAVAATNANVHASVAAHPSPMNAKPTRAVHAAPRATPRTTAKPADAHARAHAPATNAHGVGRVHPRPAAAKSPARPPRPASSPSPTSPKKPHA